MAILPPAAQDLVASRTNEGLAQIGSLSMIGNEESHRSPLTIDDVARAAGVSRSTVSLVLRESQLVAAATSEKVRKTIDALGYVYNRQAAIRARLSYLVGVVIPDLTNPFFSELAAGVDTVLNQAGWVSLVGNSWDSVEGQDRILQRMREHKVDAVILCPASEPSSADKAPSTSGMRTLQVLRRTNGANNYLGVDYSHGVATAVEHLFELGHTSILFLGGERHHSAAIERHAGFGAAMHSHHLRPAHFPCALTRSAAADAVTELYGGKNKDRPTALVCFNDVVAMGAMAGLERLGLQVGKDVSVVGFDNVVEAEFVHPPLTTIDSDARGLGVEAATIVLESVRSGTALDWNSMTPTRLVVRRSTGPVSIA